MTQDDTARLVKPYAKGQITIPADFRKRLGIDENSILEIRLKGTKLEISPLKVVDEERLLREYDTETLEAFLEEDKIDATTAAKVRQLLGG